MSKIINNFIDLEGLDGAGKTSSMIGIIKYLDSLMLECVRTREPGGTPIAEEVRVLLKEGHRHSGHTLSERSTLAGMFLCRYDLYEKVIEPALLDENKVVVSDRFAGSSYAYQVANNRKLKPMFDMLLEQGEFAPRFTIFLDVSYEESCNRMTGRGDGMDAIEKRNQGKDKFDNLRDGYMEYLNNYQKDSHVIIDTTNLSESEVIAKIIEAITIK